jgi:hypothetical protein
MDFIPTQTRQFIQDSLKILSKSEDQKIYYRFGKFHFYEDWLLDKEYELPVERCKELIYRLEQSAKEHHSQLQNTEEVTEQGSDRYPIFHETLEVIPIYKEAVVLEHVKPLVRASEIPTLLYLLGIPSKREGLDIENHNFGFHFHYGKVKSNSIVRTNLLLTFDPILEPTISKTLKEKVEPPLFGEYHAEGKTKKIWIETIGTNKRKPIYLVCCNAAKNRGYENFKRPGASAQIFHKDDAG